MTASSRVMMVAVLSLSASMSWAEERKGSSLVLCIFHSTWAAGCFWMNDEQVGWSGVL